MTEVVDLADAMFCKGCEAQGRGHLDQALRFFEAGGRIGCDLCQVSLGNLFDDYLLLKQPQKAIYWYVRAYRNGNGSAAWNLAMHYVPRLNRRWFRFWIDKAAAMGHEDALAEQAKYRKDPNYITVLPLMDQDNEPYEAADE